MLLAIVVNADLDSCVDIVIGAKRDSVAAHHGLQVGDQVPGKEHRPDSAQNQAEGDSREPHPDEDRNQEDESGNVQQPSCAPAARHLLTHC